METCCRWMAGLWLVLLVGCALDPPTLPQDPATIDATPVAAATPRATTTFIPTTPTIVPSSTPTPTHPAASTPDPTPPASVVPSSSPLVRTDESYCRRPFGVASAARFSARLDDVHVRAAHDRMEVVLQFQDVQGALHGVAGCHWAGAWPQTNDLGAPTAPDAAFIALDLADWAHDDAFAASILTDTLTVTQSAAFEADQDPLTPTPNPQPPTPLLAMSANSLDSRGALLGIGLGEPRPFNVRVEDDRLILSIVDENAASFPPINDPLGQAQGAAHVLSDLFFVQDETLFRLNATGTQPVSTTLTAITDLALNNKGTQLAVCAAHLDGAEQQVLWVLDVDGSNERVLADVGSCAEPAWSSDDGTIAFAAPADTSGEAVSTVWTVPVTDGEPTPMHAAWDQWSRSAPRWLDDDRLVYRATDENGASMLLIYENGTEREISARLLTGTAYGGVGAFVVDADQDLIAVQALHANDDGADLVLLRADGSVLATEQRGFRQQPLGFTNDGLLYLTIECPSDTVQPYALRRRRQSGAIETLLSGSTTHMINAAVVLDDALLYVRAPANDTVEQASEVWLLANGGATRTRVDRAQTPVPHVMPAP